MKRFLFRCRKSVTLIALLSLSLALPPIARATSPVKLTKWSGNIDFSTERTSPFVMSGNASHLGKFTAYGEVDFLPGETAGTFVGNGVVVFTASNGDLLVGNVAWDVDAGESEIRTSHIHFSWSDSVLLSNGTTVSNTGRFIDSRPPGLVVIAIIAILIGLLVPAVQK